MYAYTIQAGLTILIGPAYRLLYLSLSSPANKFIKKLNAVQAVFFSSNGFFIASSAIASLVHLSQSSSGFEVAEM
jgi:hypothetical protein